MVVELVVPLAAVVADPAPLAPVVEVDVVVEEIMDPCAPELIGCVDPALKCPTP